MKDIDEREGRAGSFSGNRFISGDWSNWQTRSSRELDSIGLLVNEYSPKMTDSELLNLVRKVESSLRRQPHNSLMASRFVTNLFSHSNALVRKSAFNSALAILSVSSASAEQILESYRLTLCHSSSDVAQEAQTFLPQFVKSCPVCAEWLKMGLKEMTVTRDKRLPQMQTATEATAYFDRNRRVKNTDMKVQRCHTIAWNADGTKLVCGAQDRRVSVATIDHGRLRWSSVGTSHTESVEQVACSKENANLFASASIDKSICVWDVRSNKPHARINTKSPNLFVTWSPCDKYIVFGDKEDKLVSVDCRMYAVCKSYEMRTHSNEFSFLGNTNNLLVATANGKVEILKVAGGEFESVSSVQAHSQQVDCATISITRDGTKMAVGATDASVSIWDTKELICERVMSRLDYPVRSAMFSSDGQFLASGSEDHFIDIAYVNDGSRVHELKIEGETFSIAWHPHQLLFAYAASDVKDKRDSAAIKVFGYSGG